MPTFLSPCSLPFPLLLFFRACSCTHLTALTGSPRLRLPHVLAGLQAAGLDADADELECILANLVFRGMIRGYISHKPPVLVLAKDNAFPPLPRVLAAAAAAARAAEAGGAADA